MDIGPHFNTKTVFPDVGIPMLKIWRSWDRLIFNMGIPILVRWHFYTEKGPRSRFIEFYCCLTHWGRVTHIYVGKLTIIGSDNGLLPGRRQAIIWTNAGILLTEPLGTNFSDILIETHTFSFKKIRLKMSSGKRRPFCLSLNVLKWVNICHSCFTHAGVIIWCHYRLWGFWRKITMLFKIQDCLLLYICLQAYTYKAHCDIMKTISIMQS